MRLFPAILGCLLVLSARAETEELKARLISEASTAAPGQTLMVGLHLQHPPGTHTYWKFPGIVGLATRIDWVLPEGVKAGEIQWPAPQKVMMARYAAQGYEGETLLMCPLTLPATFQEKTLVLRARVSWMHCGKTCHPATDVPFSLTLPVGRAMVPDPANQPLFQTFRARLPAAPTEWKSITVDRKGGKIVLTLDPVRRGRDPSWTDPPLIRFFTADGQVDSDQEQQVQVSAEGVIVMTLTASSTGPGHPGFLPGVLEIPTAKGPRCIEIQPRG